MSFSVNPREFQSMKIGTEKEQKMFLFKLSQLLTEMSSATGALQKQIMGLNPVVQYLGTITTNQTVICNGSFFVWVGFTSAVTQTITITLNGLPQGACVQIFPVITANTLTLKVAGTDQNGNAYDVAAILSTTGAFLPDLTSTGAAYTATSQLLGSSGYFTATTQPRLQLIST